METHTFPLAQDQAAKLDRLSQRLPDQFASKARDFIRQNPEAVQWVAVGVFAFLGVIVLRKLFSNTLI
jgi:hypothetical protein